MKAFLSLIAVAFCSVNFTYASEWSLQNLVDVLGGSQEHVFCNAASGKFTIGLKNNILVASGLQYGNMFFDNTRFEDAPCLASGADVICSLDSRRSVAISLSGVTLNPNDWDGPGNPGPQYELQGQVTAGNFFPETEDTVCTISIE